MRAEQVTTQSGTHVSAGRGGDTASGDTPPGRAGWKGVAWPAWVGLLARLVLGGALLVAGATKVGRPLVSARAVQAYQIFPFDLAAGIGYALPVVEIIVGVLLIIGLFTRPMALVGALLMLAFIAGIASAWARGLTIDCGCFGGGGTIGANDTKYPQEIARDVVFALCGVWLLARPCSVWSVDRRLAGSGR